MNYVDSVALGASPYLEDAAQVGKPYYAQDSILECRAYINQLSRTSSIPSGARLFTKSNPHDFGTYREVEVAYSDAESADFAFALESRAPSNWDLLALQEIYQSLLGYLPDQQRASILLLNEDAQRDEDALRQKIADLRKLRI